LEIIINIHSMKKLILISITILSSCVAYQKISYQEPFIKIYEDVPGDKNQLFLKANEWMVKTFNSAESVIQYSDKEEGVIIGKYLMFGEIRTGAYGISVDSRVYAKIDIRVKDGRALISIEPMGEWSYDPSGFTIYKFGKEQCQAEMESLIESLRAALVSKSTSF